jgi:crotonobetainyl-CoA:carnitine CoA-transferase CaiB-like acyl-CoA transferase
MQNLMFRMQDTPGRIRFAGRRLGQDTEAILSDGLGLTAEEVNELRQDGVL